MSFEKKKTDTNTDDDTSNFVEYSLLDFDKAIADLGIKLNNEAMTTTNSEYKFKLVDAIVKLRGALPPFYAMKNRGR